jgi:outer membrane protein
MRKYVFLVLAILPFMVQAQKYACVNTDYILRSVPEYNQALNKINKYVSEWKSELEAKQQEVDELREQYQQEAYLLPDNLKQRRQDEIRTKETDLRRLQQQRFSAGGDLDQKRAELMKPVQDRVYNAIERVAREKNYAFVFDKACAATVLYVADKYDISNQVLEMLGVKPGAAPEGGINPNAGEGRQKSAAGQQEKQRQAPPAAERKERM